MEEYNITAWNIKGDNSGAQIWIRFQGEGNMENFDNHYRKIPPGQVKRNKNRAALWKDKEKKNDTILCERENKDHIEDNSISDNSIISDSNPPPCSVGSAFNTPPTLQDMGATAVESTSHSTNYATDQINMCDINSNENRRITRSFSATTQDSPLKHFHYKDKKMNSICTICWKRFTTIQDLAYVCDRCPGPKCVMCIDNGKHSQHKRFLRGPVTLHQLADPPW